MQSVAGAYLALLASRGVNFLFGNGGTDFAPIIEAYAEAAQKGVTVPRPILATHENLAVSMAHGYAMISREIPAVMVHVSVGTANMVCPAMNAARENVGLLLSAGRSPLTESGMFGARDGYIHWSQEMYDQAGLIREFLKWDYELRNAEQLETVVDRALAIAASEPRGPVYLTLPREILGLPAPAASPSSPSRLQAAAPAAPDARAIETAAEWLLAAGRPLIITANGGRDPAGFAALDAFAERFAIAVTQHKPRYLSLRSSHPMNLGYDPTRRVGDADLIMVIESDAPWFPAQAQPAASCKVIQCGFDPLFTRIPIRGFACDLGVVGGTEAILSALTDALVNRADENRIHRRRDAVAAERASLVTQWEATRVSAAQRAPLHPAWVSSCVSDAKDADAIVVNEYTLLLEHCSFEQPDCYFGSSAASGLGWGAGAALGAKLAAPERQTIAVLGDGAYLFSNPVSVHHAAAMHNLPVLFVVMNNSMWGAVRSSALAMYPEGWASKSNDLPFTSLGPLPAFEQICTAAGGYGERVEDPGVLPAALQRALQAVKNEGRQALLNVICGVE
ncbi:MAG: acetolactate synthase large subunit [Methylobacteriaceae bacterium]|jgi:acetolactate synthase-1/2/3 large subunit|nr:acetolactate synthase large subunit [Methylobacteriaceae bacterium]